MEVDIVQLCETQDNDCDLCYMLSTMLQGTPCFAKAINTRDCPSGRSPDLLDGSGNFGPHMIAMGISLTT